MDTYKPAYAIKLSAKNFGFETIKKPFLSMPHFVSEINIATVTLTENVGVIFSSLFMPKIPVNLEKGGKSSLLFKIKML